MTLVFQASWGLDKRLSELADLVADCVALKRTCFSSVIPPSVNPDDPGTSSPDPSNVPLFCNIPQTCTSTCPDGTVFTYTVPAGMFLARTVIEANEAAYAYACKMVQQKRICLSGLTIECCCYNESFTTDIVASGVMGVVTWSLISGSLPPGLSLTFSGNTATISGTPTTAGTYNFSVKAVSPFGGYARKDGTLRVIRITTASLPDFEEGVAYSQQLEATGGSGNYTWEVSSGTLPDGITLSADGLLSGTPTDDVDCTFTVSVSDNAC